MEITAAQFLDLVKALPAQYQDTARGAGKRDFARNLVGNCRSWPIRRSKLGLDQQPDTKGCSSNFRKTTCSRRRCSNNLQQTAAISDGMFQAYYDAHKVDYETPHRAPHPDPRQRRLPYGPRRANRSSQTMKRRPKRNRSGKRIVGGEDFRQARERRIDQIPLPARRAGTSVSSRRASNT